MSRFRSLPLRAGAALALVLSAAGSPACSDEGQAVPERCVDPPLPIFDFRQEPPPDDDNRQYPCVTPVGHALGPTGGTTSAGGAPATGLAGDAGAGGT